ncbi:hypothetical protein ACHAWF_007394 [Thalassiosira exigua]
MRMSSANSATASQGGSSGVHHQMSDVEKAAYTELSTLSAKMRTFDELYYGGSGASSSRIDDEEYDALARREAELCADFPHLLELLEKESVLGKKATRFGGRVGRYYNDKEPPPTTSGGESESADAPRSNSKAKKAKPSAKKRIKRRHLPNAPMQSLDNAMNNMEAVVWLNRIRKLLLSSDDGEEDVADDEGNATKAVPIEVMAEPKIDGLSLSIRYALRDSGNSLSEAVYDFEWGATRGDGAQGEDVSEAVRSAWMSNSCGNLDDKGFSVPQTLTISSTSSGAVPPDIVEVRGEVVLPQRAFEEFVRNVTDNTTGTYSNARNAASGILLRSKEPTSEAEVERTRFLQSHLQFYAYDIVASSTSPNSTSWLSAVVGGNGNEMMQSLANLGFSVPIPVVNESLDISSELDESDVPNLLEYHGNLMSTRDKSLGKKLLTSSKQDNSWHFPYQIDGVVYKLASFEHRQMCGSSSRTPRWAIAHKFPPQSAITRLVDIEIQVGRTGALTPVAILEPTNLGGAVVTRASLHNFHHARKILANEDSKDEGTMSVKRGVSVLISRAGDVIPQVTKRVYDDGGESLVGHAEYVDQTISLEAPQKCPSCGSPTTFVFVTARTKAKKGAKKNEEKSDSENDTELISAGNSTASSIADIEVGDADGGQVLRCSGPQLLCQPRAVNALAHAYSRDGLDVKGLSKAKLSHLMEEGIIHVPSDLFATLGRTNGEDPSIEEEMLNKIADLPGWGELSSRNLADSVRSVASEGVSLSRYIYSLGIPLVGVHVSRLLASSFGTVESFLNSLDEASNIDENDDASATPFAILAGDNGTEKVLGIGPTTVSALLSFSREEALVKAAKDLAKQLTIHDDSDRANLATEGNQSDASHKQLQFEGMTVVFTGILPDMSRTAAQNAVKALGAKATPSSVSKSTSLVVEGERGGKKARQARELGVRVIDSEEFTKLIGGTS